MSKTNLSHLESLRPAILKLIKKRKSSLNIKQIAWELKLNGKKYQQRIQKILADLEQDKLVVRREKYKFQYNPRAELILGTVDINKRGNGYVLSDACDDDIFIEEKDLLNSLNGDLVSVQITRHKKNGLSGKIKEVLKRAKKKFIGIIKCNDRNIFFIPDNEKVGSDFFIPKDKLNGAKNNDRVIVKFLEWPLSAGCPFGSVVKVLNNASELKDEINNTIDLFDLRNSFSSGIKKELKMLKDEVKTSEIKLRRDFRKDITFTIDPNDAKDFDDALSISFLPNNKFSIGIHIADVAHYVKPNSEIDKEAFLRAFSIYFPGKVIPMLPEKLSNLICSLRPNEDKLCFSVVVEFDSKLSQSEEVWFGKGVINSNHRFTYEDVESILNTRKGLFFEELDLMNRLASKLRMNRMKNGSINFNRTNTSFELNNDGEPIKILKREPLKSHKLVEEFMLLANKQVAKRLQKCIYRVHDLPNKDALKEVAIYLKNSKIKEVKLDVKSSLLSSRINKLLKNPNINQAVFQNLILRAMSKANYSIKNIGHYGLGFEEYTHFTSPIRRYADLIIHRFLYMSIENQKYTVSGLKQSCDHFSTKERLYVDVERSVDKFVKLKLLEKSVGKVFDGIITGLVKWGIYVELEGGIAEGMVSSKKLKDGNYYYNENLRSFIERKSGKKYMLGQSLVVEISDINLLKKEMDLNIV